MFKKVLVAEDMDSINNSTKTILNSLGIFKIEHVQYCDDAMLKVKKAILDKKPFDLFICDLNFKEDHRVQKIKSGESLIVALRELHLDLKIIVFSVEDRVRKIRALFNEYQINAFVCKGRYGLNHLKEAISLVYNNKNYTSPEISGALNSLNIVEIENYDIELMKLLSEGFSQYEIGERFKNEGVYPCSISSIEKRLSKLKDYFKAKNSIHLVSIIKDMGLI